MKKSYYTAEEFDRYAPGHTAHLGPNQLHQLEGWLCRELDQLPGDYLTVLVLHFLVGWSLETVHAVTHIPHVRGIVELLRFRCGRYLGRDTAVSDRSMARALCLWARDCEVVLLTRRGGICFFTGKRLGPGLIAQALTQARRRCTR